MISLQEELLGHWTIDEQESNASLTFFHRLLNNIYDREKMDIIFHNDITIKYAFLSMLEKDNITKSDSTLDTSRLTNKGRHILDKLNELYGEITT